jgi:hypothetical protein
MITTKSEMNILGVLFDTKLTWAQQVANAIRKSSKALNAIKIITIIQLLEAFTNINQ